MTIKVLNPSSKEIITGLPETIYKDFADYPYDNQKCAVFIKNGHKVVVYQMDEFYILKCLEYDDYCKDLHGINRIEKSLEPIIDSLLKNGFLYVMNHMYYKNRTKIM